MLKNPNSTHFSLAVLGLDIQSGSLGLKPRAWQGWFLLRVLEKLVLPVPLRSGPLSLQSRGVAPSLWFLSHEGPCGQTASQDNLTFSPPLI